MNPLIEYPKTSKAKSLLEWAEKYFHKECKLITLSIFCGAIYMEPYYDKTGGYISYTSFSKKQLVNNMYDLWSINNT